MKVADKLQHIGLLFANDGLVAILEEMADATVTEVEADGMAGEQSSLAPGLL